MQRPRPAHGRQPTQNASAADSSRRSATNWKRRSRSPDALRPRHRTQRHAAPNGLALPSAPFYCRFSRLANYLVTQPGFRSRAPAPKRTGGTYSLPSPRPAAAATHPTRAPPLVALLLLPFFSIPITALLRTARATRTVWPSRSPSNTPASGSQSVPRQQTSAEPRSTSDVARASCTKLPCTPSCSTSQPASSRSPPRSGPSGPPSTPAAPAR